MTTHDGGVTAVPVRLRSGIAPTPMQRGLLASQGRHPTSPLQNMALLSHLDGPVDVERLVAAFEQVVRASDVLRSRFEQVDGASAVQVVDSVVPTAILELSRSDVAGWAAERAAVPIDMGRCGYDSVVVRHEDGTASWYLALHHAITDATSSMLVFERTAEAYAGASVELDSYYEWWASRTPDRRTERAVEHWRSRRDSARVGQLYRPVVHGTPSSRRVTVELERELREAVEGRLGDDFRSVSDELGWTTLLTTVAACYLHRLTGVTSTAIGVPMHNRSDPSTRSLIGPLMEVFPVDVEIEPGDSFRDLHRRVGRALMSTLRHARPATAPAASDCEALVNVIARAGLGSFGAVPATTRWVHSGATDPNHLFRLQLTNYGDDLELLLDLNRAAADELHVERAPDHVRAVLGALVADPDRPIAERTICPPDELAAIRAWGAGPDAGPAPPSVVERLESALADRDDVALEADGVTLTGRRLWARASALAGWLRSRGIGSDDGPTRVAIEMQRDPDAVVAILGTLLAGGSYVPLDPAQPADRRARLAERASCRVVLRELPDLDGMPGLAERPPASGDREAYLLFTSGSTGEPKGVPITHAGLARYLQFAIDHYVPDHEPPVAPLFSALTFDLTVTSLFVPLLTGGRLVVITPDGPAGLAAVARHRDLNWCKATPSHLEVLLRLDPEPRFNSLVVGGEAFPGRLARRLFRVFPGARIFNEYGPTEAVVGCMIHETTPESLGDGADVPIGRPAPGVRLRVVDAHLHDVPIGAPGELLIHHDGVTSGYLDAADDTPFHELDGARWYRSGDLVRLDDPDTLLYLGRIDEQIKVGGIRLEPTEIEQELTAHPAVERAAVRIWTPSRALPTRHCVRCGLPDTVPGVGFDDDGVCDTCHAYEQIRDRAAAYFRTPDDLAAIRDRARRERTGRHDCIHLLSGGKDSTYALYQLVEMGFDVYALTLDNGYISDGAKENVRRSVADLGIEHEFATTEAMDEIFRDSLERHSNVCNGCYKTLYTLATTRAVELGAPVIVTGLSRGQLFETRLIPQQFSIGRFDPEAIDRAVIEARRAYHRVDDAARRLLDTSVFDDGAFDDGDVFERVSYVDFYRYLDVELAEMLEFLGRSAPWVRPADTGRSTNCLINAAGIHNHLTEQGYHNYAVPYAWDVRLGHKTRQEAIDELDDDIDLAEVDGMLARVGHRPTPRQILTAWYELGADAVEPQPAELRAFLAARLPAHAIPAAFVAVDRLEMTRNGKLDAGALPPPSRVHRPGPALHVAAESQLESAIVAVYERVLGLEPVSVVDDFFELGGDSLAALGLAVQLSDELGRTVRDELVFAHRTPRALAEAIESTGDGDDAVVSRRPDGAPPPTSAAEQALLFEHLNDPGDPRYNVGHLFRVRGPLDTERFVAALRTVVEAHGPLHWTHGDPRRRLSADDALDVLVRSSTLTDGELADALRRYHVQPFDLTNGPLARCVIQPLDDGSVAVLLVVHHVAIDAGSFDRLWAQVDLAYQGAALPEAPFDYGDLAAWQLERLTDERIAPWLDRGPAGRVEFPGADGDGGGYLQRTASFTADELRAGPGTTPFATALAALAVVLRPYAADEQVGLGVTVSTREHTDADDLVGLFLNTVPVAVEVPADATFAEVAASSDEAIVTALAARTVPLSRIVAARRAADLPELPVNVLVAFEEWHVSRLGALEAEHEVLATGSPVADATFFVQLAGSRVELSIEHRNAALGPDLAARLLDAFDRGIRTAIDHPRAPWGELAGGAPTTAEPMVRGPELPADERVLHALIEERARRRPGHPAISYGERLVDYGELDARAGEVARALRGRGIGPQCFVGVVAARHPDAVVAILGVLKAGAAYVPIDPGYPADRIAHIVADAGLTTILGPSSGSITVDSLPDGAELIDVDAVGPEADDPARPRPVPDVEVGPDDPAYVIYTSGSTGAPKGVVVRHRNIVASTNARALVYERSPERFLALSSFAFDSSLVGLFWTLCTGGTLVLPPAGRDDDVLALADVIERRRVTHLLALPSLLRLLESEATPEQLASLDTAIVAGEACPYAVVELHRARCPGAVLVNEYGPTEGTVWSHACVVDGTVTGDPVPIGGPIPGVVHVVLDESGRPVRAGESGELLLAGTGIAAGYLGRPDLTRERFVDLDPDVTGGPVGPWYRTGDLVRTVADGRLAFVGRVDDQVKVRGYRVEPAEVEVALRAVPGVRDAAVGAAELVGRPQLVAWLVPDDAVGTPDASTLRARLAETLPHHLVPTRFVTLPSLPIGPNGKLDRRALPAPDATPAADDQPPVDATGGDSPEGRLAAIWADVLGVGSVGPDDDFFELGGDSIVSLQIAARARRAGIEIRPRQLFEHPTVAELAAAAGVRRPVTDQVRVVGSVPLTPIQHWFFEQRLAEPDWWNQTIVLEVAPDTRIDELVSALELVRDHHDQLRASFDTNVDPPRQSIADEATPAVVSEIDLRSASDRDELDAVIALESSLDLACGRVVGVLVCRDGDVPRRVVVTIHHLVVDAVSWSVIIDDWSACYEALVTGATPALPERSTSFRDWASALHAAAADGRFTPTSPLGRSAADPIDDRRERGLCESAANRVDAARVVSVSLGPEQTAALVGPATGGGDDAPTVEEVLLAAIAIVLPRHLGSHPLIVGLEGHGREDAVDPRLDPSRTVGWFTTLFPVDLAVSDRGDAARVLDEVRARVRRIPDRGIGYGVERYLRAGARPAAPLPVVAVNYLGQVDRAIRPAPPFTVVGELRGSIAPVNRRAHLLGILASVRSGRLTVAIDHLPEHLEPSAVTALADELLDCLVELTAARSPRRPSFDLVDLSDADTARLGELLDGLD